MAQKKAAPAKKPAAKKTTAATKPIPPAKVQKIEQGAHTDESVRTEGHKDGSVK